jgi:hypothetical protein
MDGDIELLRRIYERFNARDIDGVLAIVTALLRASSGRTTLSGRGSRAGGDRHARTRARTYH